MTLEKQGTCLCGETHLKVTVDNTHISACHCSMCRKWTGGPLLVVHCSHPPTIEGRTPSVYDSSDWAQRGFVAGAAHICTTASKPTISMPSR